MKKIIANKNEKIKNNGNIFYPKYNEINENLFKFDLIGLSDNLKFFIVKSEKMILENNRIIGLLLKDILFENIEELRNFGKWYF